LPLPGARSHTVRGFGGRREKWTMNERSDVTKENFSARRINRVARALGSTRYLEIGVSHGVTFHAVKIENRVAVDPRFQFKTSDFENPSTKFFEVPSDAYFDALGDDVTYDQFFIDGLHTFEQTLRDFSNTLLHSHRRTVWLIDDTKPSDVYSSLPDNRDTFLFRGEVGRADDHSWHGDVYKVVAYIHDFCPGLDYRTIVGSGNIQTLVWRSKQGRRVPKFKNLESISRLTYFDLRKSIDLLREASEEDAIGICLKALLPA
jgi:hypothetical protein